MVERALLGRKKTIPHVSHFVLHADLICRCYYKKSRLN
jgi:hypothetical protein